MSQRPTTEVETEEESRFPVFEPEQILADRFRIVKQLSEGDHSTVYVARDLQQKNSTRALKFYAYEISESRATATALKSCIQKFGELRHRNLAQVFGWHDGGKNSALITEYVDGYDLQDRFQGEEPPSIDETIGILAQTCSALIALHQNASVHGNLKPHNIMVTLNGVVKLTDYGCADVLGVLANQPVDYEYAPPEQFRGVREYGVVRDVYAVGVLGYHLLTHKELFDYESIEEIVQKKLTKDPTPPHEINPDCPRELSDLLMRALSRNKRERFTSVEELLEHLEVNGLVRNEHFVSVIPGFRRWVGVFGLKLYQVANAATKGGSSSSEQFRLPGDPLVYGIGVLLVGLGIVGIWLSGIGRSDETQTGGTESSVVQTEPKSATSKNSKEGAGSNRVAEKDNTLLEHAAKRPESPKDGTYYLFMDGEFVLVDRDGKILEKPEKAGE